MADSRDSLLRTEWRLINVNTGEESLFNSDGETLDNPFCPLLSSTEYSLEARHIGKIYGASDWSNPLSFSTSSINAVAPGEADCGSSTWSKVGQGEADCDSTTWLNQEYIAKPNALCVYTQKQTEIDMTQPVYNP